MTNPTTEKRNVWDIFDVILPQAVDAYKKIRGTATTKEDPLTAQLYPTKIVAPAQDKKDNTLLYVLGGAVVLGAVGFFIYKKYKK